MSGTPAKKATPQLADILGKDKDKDNNTTPATNVGDNRERPVGPDSDKKNVHVDAPDSTESNNDDFTAPSSDDYVDPNNDDPFYSPAVTAMKSDKTPAELSMETPEETAKRYNIDTRITDEDADNPRVQVYRDTLVNQVPSGTHLHPDIAKDLKNRGIAEQHTDNAQVKRMVTDGYDFAPDAEHNDKWNAPVKNDEKD